MKRHLTIAKHLSMLCLALSFVLPLSSFAATVTLATSPLATSTVSKVKPNVMFILDDSGSMDLNYLPDWANDPHPASGIAYTSATELFKNAGFNGLAYDPAIVYTPPVFYDADGTLNITKYLTQNGTSASGTGTNGQGGGSTTTPRWTSVQNDAYGVQSTGSSNLEGNADHYVFIPGEYCSTDRMTSCVTATAPTTVSGVVYDKPAVLRWCNSAALTNCQSINSSTYKYPRYPTAPVGGTAATATITVTNGGNATSIKVNGVEILSATASNGGTNNLARSIRDNINNCTDAVTGNCAVDGYSATRNNNIVTIYAPITTGSPITFTPVLVQTGGMTSTVTAFSGGVAASSLVPGSNLYTDIVSTTTSYPYPGGTTKNPTRIDCAGTTCTYNEEMTNYANWRTYYRTRMQSMKTSVSRAFKTIDDKFRVGFTTISDTGATDGSTFLGNNTFELAHKNSWYTKLFATNTPVSTPLRGALSKAGRYYGNKISGQVDPVQYSCQQNFTILSTDGYWNTFDESASYTALDLTGSAVGNQDASTSDKAMKEGATAVSDTLADIAMYYYNTDLRTGSTYDPKATGEPTLNNCAGAVSTDFPTGNPDVCTDNVFTSNSDKLATQHMTTFTMGLGADGTLVYTPEYKDADSGDYYDLKNGYGSPATRWSNPIANSGPERIDDLWHAAVNGRGTYFSAKDPNQIVSGFNKALKSINAKLGAAAAAATSTLNPVAGNNYAFVASYTTVRWTGNLEAREINVGTGVVNETATWCVEDVPDTTSCSSSGSIVADTSGSSTVYNCVVPSSTAATCLAPSVFNTGTSECKTEVQKACVGKMPLQVGETTDTRNIYTAPAGGLTALVGQNLVPFDAAYATANPTSFASTKISGLSQWTSLTGPGVGTQQAAAVGTNLINYLRGRSDHEERSSNPVVERLYRARDSVLGDALESQPAYMGAPVFSYAYSGYSAFKTGTAATRPGVTYMGTNDGMMHAFYAKNQTTTLPCVISSTNYCGGQEAWAYVPSMVIPEMWKLANTNYDTNHVNLVNGSPVTSDVCVAANCSTAVGSDWRTILVGGLNAGGRGYYALDITTPTTPKLLWEFTNTSGLGNIKDDDLGYSYGQPIITKLANGTWVVIVSSGYNNLPGTSGNAGKGFLYVLNANTGAIISKTSTGAGDSTTPSGLAKISGWNDDPAGNQVGFVYGGDLLGNLWRFNVNTCTGATPSSCEVMKLAKLYSTTAGTAGTEQPITTTPVLGNVSGNRVVFVGTGKYLETGDLNTVNASATQQQTQYAIKDSNPTGTIGTTNTIVNPRNTLVSQTLGNPNAQNQRLVTTSTGVNFSTGNGWFVDFPAVASGPSERVNIDSQLVQGTLLVPTIIPSNTACAPGGSGWLNFFDYRTGRGVTSSNVVSSRYNSTIVGINVIYINGQPKVGVVTSTNPTPEINDDVLFSGTAGSFTGKRTLWRELVQ